MFISDIYASTDTIPLQGSTTLDIAPEPVQPDWWTSLVPMVLIFVIVYFLLIRPQDKKRRQHEQLVNNVKKGEEVITNNGLFGKITAVNDSDNTVMVQFAEKVEFKMLKNAISDIVKKNTSTSKKLPNKSNKKSSKNTKPTTDKTT